MAAVTLGRAVLLCCSAALLLCWLCCCAVLLCRLSLMIHITASTTAVVGVMQVINNTKGGGAFPKKSLEALKKLCSVRVVTWSRPSDKDARAHLTNTPRPTVSPAGREHRAAGLEAVR